ncbi:unnamed protein product, partial [Bubo scandiacus]
MFLCFSDRVIIEPKENFYLKATTRKEHYKSWFCLRLLSCFVCTSLVLVGDARAALILRA